MVGRMRVYRTLLTATGVCLIALGIPSGPSGAAALGAQSSSSHERFVGHAIVTNEPTGWQPSNFYLIFCPSKESFSLECAGQLSGSPNQITGAFSVRLPAQPWTAGMYYYTVNGQMMLSKGTKVPPAPGSTIHRNIEMPYVVPAVEGTVSITGAPSNFDDIAYMGVQACPVGTPFSAVGCANGQEAYEGIGPGLPYLIDLAPGRWNVADYYRVTNNSETFAGVPVTLTAKKGITQTINVSMAYQGI
jgi:hypothetical protein